METISAALAASVNMAALAVNKADKARIRNEVDIRRSLQGWCAPARLEPS
jgi:hypothetical protein